MVKVIKVSSGTKWEDQVGYSRGIKAGNFIEIAGTTATDESGNIIGLNDPYKQTCYIIRKAETAIMQLGGKLEDVIRTRIYTTDISIWEEIGRAHGEFFGKIKPVATMVEVSALINPDLLVEIEFTGFVEE